MPGPVPKGGRQEMMTDPVADLLTRIRNANMVYHETVDVPASKLKKAIVEILRDEGFIKNYEVLQDGARQTLRIYLKYGSNKERVISGLKRISKPGLRVYAQKDEIPRVLGGLGIAILSTSKGVMTDKQARKLGIGGEVLCYVW
ncbi:MAG: 30S ribosomal protein S8 [Clostridia bacterium 62_21]|nr:MAG: 30S ribosomal protein S8 [Clostridia bacterium 62_21]